MDLHHSFKYLFVKKHNYIIIEQEMPKTFIFLYINLSWHHGVCVQNENTFIKMWNNTNLTGSDIHTFKINEINFELYTKTLRFCILLSAIYW